MFVLTVQYLFRLLHLASELPPSLTLNLGWLPSCCDHASILKQREVIERVRQPVSLLILITDVRKSWSNLREILRSSDQTSITLVASNLPHDDLTIYDMLHLRNDCDKHRIFYNLGGPLFEEFKKLAVTGGIPIHKYTALDNDSSKVSWCHAANSKALLKAALRSKWLSEMLYSFNSEQFGNTVKQPRP